ncbi:MAG: hypothetical protein KDK55_07010 [Chlamydiia bacterium]|nr:hypothetical protein [Chlamydiia bacterium]
MEGSFSVDSIINSSPKGVSLSSKPRATLETSDFSQVMANKEAEQINSVQSFVKLEKASQSMAKAEETFVKMGEFQKKIETAYRNLLKLSPDE